MPLPREIAIRYQIVERMGARPLPVPDVPLQRFGATEPPVDHQTHQAEDRDAGNPANRDIVEAVGKPDAARHGGSEHEEDHDNGRAMLVLDVLTGERTHTMLIATQGIDAYRIHFALPIVLKLIVPPT
jgi:hypothetical protein